MAFQKAKAQQAWFKAGCYGKAGSGKTLTSLLFAEGLAKLCGKRVAMVDTERGSDFYVQRIPERTVHPEAFDIDCLYTRSLMEAVEAVESLDTDFYGVVIIDSMTHLWEAAIAAYTGKKMSNGQVPIQAWGQIKRPYKRLMTALLNGNFHFIICGREGVQMEDDEEGEAKVVGTKMKAEGETGYEPHVLFRFHHELDEAKEQRICMRAIKDRTGILQGRQIFEPDFSTIQPILRYLGAGSQGELQSADKAAEVDAAKIEEHYHAKEAQRIATYEQIRRAIRFAENIEQLQAAWSLTKGKKTLLGDDLMTNLEASKDAAKLDIMKAVA